MAAVSVLWTIMVLCGGCATAIPGVSGPPQGWQSTAVTRCSDIAGSYVAQGVPAVSNASAGYSLWPAMGSLVAMIERGSNGIPYSKASQVRIAMSSDTAVFVAFDSSDEPQSLAVREWWCSQGALETRATLGIKQEEATNTRDESVVRLWKSEDGALIAENTIESLVPKFRRSSVRHTPLARFYFRFSPMQSRGEFHAN